MRDSIPLPSRAARMVVRRLLFTFLLVASVIPHQAAGVPPHEAAQGGLGYLRSRQSADGKIENYATSAWAAIAFGAAGTDSDSVKNGSVSLRGYLTAHHPRDTDPVSEWERQVLAFLAMGVDPRSVDGRDYVAAIEGFAAEGQIGDPGLYNDDMFGLLALLGAGVARTSPVVSSTALFLLKRQNADGGWGFAEGIPSDVDLTGIMVQLMPLVSNAGDATWSDARTRARSFLAEAQNADGGFPNGQGGQSNTASTAWVIQGIIALGEDPDAWERQGNTPVSYLLSTQQQSSQGFSWLPGFAPSALMTSYAVPALFDASLPVRFTAALPPPALPPADPPPSQPPPNPPPSLPPADLPDLPQPPLPPQPETVPAPAESAPVQEARDSNSPAVTGSTANGSLSPEPLLPLSILQKSETTSGPFPNPRVALRKDASPAAPEKGNPDSPAVPTETTTSSSASILDERTNSQRIARAGAAGSQPTAAARASSSLLELFLLAVFFIGGIVLIRYREKRFR